MPKTSRKPQALYSVHPGIAMAQKWVEELPSKTGRSLDEWVALTQKSCPPDQKARTAWLKSEHGFGTNQASWIAARASGNDQVIHEVDDDAYLRSAEENVEKMYTGPKASLKPIYDTLLDLGLKLGNDVRACPCKTMVPFYRKHVFAQIKPTTNTRIDLGFALKDHKVEGRLIDTGGFAKKDRITHRIPISSLKEIDAEVKSWLKLAYEMDV